MNLSLLRFDQFAAAMLITVVWQAGLLTFVAALALRLLPRISAAARFAVWAGVFVLLLMLPFVPAMHPSGAQAVLRLDSRWSVAIAIVWASLSLFRAVELAGAFRRLRAVWMRAKPLPLPPLADARNARLCLSPDVLRPSVIGFFHPRILIPESLYASLTPAELDHILLHERQHLRRRDDWLNLLQKLGLVLFPLNPALLWVERRLCFERELACDDSVLAITNAPQSYARSLVSLAEHTVLGRQLSLALGAWGQRSELSRRVHRILAARTPALTTQRASAVVALLCTGLLGGVAALSRTPRLVSFVSSAATSASATNLGAAALPSSGVGSTLRTAGSRTADHTAYRAVQVDANIAASPKMVDAILHSEPKQHPDRHKTHRAAALRRPVPSPRRSLAAYAVPLRAQTAKVQLRTISERAGLNTNGSDQVVMNTSGMNSSGMNPSGLDRRAVWTATRFSSSLPTPTIVFAVFTSSTGSPSYAAVPTPNGWLVVQL